jgi:hypothetical protein
MKIIIVSVFTIVLLFSHLGNAQFLKSYGLKGAFTSADQKLNYTYVNIETKRRIGFNAAVFVEWFSVPYFSLVTQCEYNQRGMRTAFAQTGSVLTIIGSFTNYNRVDYLSIPVFAKLAIPLYPVSPYLLIGPRFDFLLGYKSDDNIFNVVYDKFSKSTAGASFAFGVDLKELLQIAILVEARYNIDMKDSYSTQYLKMRNNAFDIWLGLAL